MAVIGRKKIMLAYQILAVILMTTSALLSFAQDSCTWQIDVVQSQFPYLFENVIHNHEDGLRTFDGADVRNLPTQEQLWLYPYFLHLQVQCDLLPNPAMSRALVSVGSYPKITVSHHAHKVQEILYDTESHYTLEGALVDLSGDCEAMFCVPVWLCPLPLPYAPDLVFHISAETVGMDTDVASARTLITVDGYSDHDPSNYSLVYTPMGRKVKLPDLSSLLGGQAYPVMTFPRTCPIQALAGFVNRSLVLVSSDYFQHIEIIEPEHELSAALECTEGLDLPIRQAATFPDRVVINTAAGLYQIFGNFHKDEDADSSQDGLNFHFMGLQECIQNLIVPQQERQRRQYLLAMTQDKQRLYLATLQFGIQRVFEEVVDVGGGRACDYTALHACDIIDATVSTMDADTLLVLLNIVTEWDDVYYHLVQYQGLPNLGEWHLIGIFAGNFTWRTHTDFDEAHKWRDIPVLKTHGPRHDLPISEHQDVANINLKMSGLSFSGYVSEHLFLWGNALLHSPDRGRTMEYLLDYDSEEEILLFLVGQDASFAFLNSANEIWYGYISTRIYMKKLRPSIGWDAAYLSGQQIYPTATATTISLFYDSWGMLYELVAFDNSSGAQIERRHINTGAILAYNSYVEGKREMENIEIGLNDEHGDGSVHYQAQSVTPLVECQCPYESIVYDIEQVFHYERTESYFLGAPQLRDSTGGHWNTSLVVYQAIVHFLLSERTAHHTLQKNELAQASHSPFRWWHEDTKAFSAFHEYLFQNNQIESGIHIDPGSYFLHLPDHSCSRPVLPHTVFLDKHDMFRFDVYLRVGLLDINMDLDDLRISLEVSDENILAVETQRWMYHLNSTIRYEVILVDQGALVHQSGPGSSLYPTSVLLQVWHSSSSCFTPDQITSEPEGIHSMDVMLGCPPGRKLVFDLKLSIENLNEQFIYDCPIKTEGRPCLHYHHDFRPLFKLVDFTTGEATLFTGMYTLVVLGGSYISADDITIFSPEKQEKYNNFNKQGQRIWKPIEKESISAGNESTPVYSHTHNGVTWICEQHSPCADVPMLNFPYSPEYYFLIEMSTLGVDTESTYCHYSLQFVVHVHGMDISGNKALVIVAWSFFASVLMVAIFIICNYDNKKLWRRIRSTCQTTDPRVKVVPVASDSSEEVELEVHYREGLNYHPADPSTTSTVIETLLTNDEDYPELPKSDSCYQTGGGPSSVRINQLTHRTVSGNISSSKHSGKT